jgi:hypothetical protein
LKEITAVTAQHYSPIPDSFTPFEDLSIEILHALCIAFTETLPRVEREAALNDVRDIVLDTSPFQLKRAFIDYLRKNGVSDA